MTNEASAPSPRRRTALPAVVAGRYEPLAKIASGGMATVYLARVIGGLSIGKLVALKCIHPHMADEPSFVNMFIDEARISARIDHPNVATVFDAGEDDGVHYLAMEYLHGEPVSALIRAWDAKPEARPPRFVELAARIIADAAMGLHAAHELRGSDGALLGLVHRDVSPQNLFVTFDGSVKVVDFGIVKAAGRIHETTTGVVKGKVAYMSPEQLSARPIDRRTDVWALGVTLWELLTARRLFRRDDQIATLNAVLDGDVPDPSSIDPRIPVELDRILQTCLSPSAERRYATARELAQALSRFITERGVHVGIGEIADLMRATFETEREEKDAWIARAREGGSGGAPAVEAAPEGAVSEVRAARGTSSEPIRLPVKTNAWVLAAMALAGVLGGAATIAVLVGAESGPEDAVADAPTAAARSVTSTPEEPSGLASAPIPRGVDVPDELTPQRHPTPAPTPAAETGAAQTKAARPTPPTARSLPPVEPAVEPTIETAVEPAPRAPAERAAPRSVRVVHPGGGWANLRVDGREARNTPTTLDRIDVGRHRFEVRPYGQGAWVPHDAVVPAGNDPFVLRIPLGPPR